MSTRHRRYARPLANITVGPEEIVTRTGQRLSIIYCTVGQSFGTCAQLRKGRVVIAETGVRPLGFTAAARQDALTLAASL